MIKKFHVFMEQAPFVHLPKLYHRVNATHSGNVHLAQAESSSGGLNANSKMVRWGNNRLFVIKEVFGTCLVCRVIRKLAIQKIMTAMEL